MGVSEILDRWRRAYPHAGVRGGDGAVARELGVPYDTVVAWRRRGRIPVDYWKKLIASARAHGLPPLDYAALVDACTQNPPPRSRLPAEPQSPRDPATPPPRVAGAPQR